MGIPFGDKGQQALRQLGLVSKIGNAQPLALQDGKPLLHLVHPRAMHRRKMEDKTWVFGQPGLHLLALMHPQMVKHHVNPSDRRGNFALQMLQKRDEFHLPFPLGRRGVDLARAGSKTGKEGQCSLARILVFDPYRLPRLCSQCRRLAGPWLSTRFLVHAEHQFPYAQGARVEGNNFMDLCCECRIPWDVRRQPQRMPPRFELMGSQNPLDRLRRDRLHYPIVHQLSG
jgi:hypothetical protein